jgi:signal transduction histidine kinase
MEAKKAQPEAIRVLLTGYTDLESVINAINQGQIYRYITKPWEPEEFLGVVHQAIEVHEMKGTIARQNDQLKKANEELKSLDQLKTDFMLLVNHELKTPLTAIFSFVQLLEEESLAPEQKLYLDKISKNTKRLQELINDTLLITKIKTDSKMNSKEDADLRQLIQEQWQSLEKDFSNQNFKLSGLSESPFIQHVNQKSMEIIFKKILHNCFIHGKPETEIQIKFEQRDDSWSLSCTNELTKDLEKTSEELLSAFSTDKDILNHSGGSGLGLAVIQAIVNLFAGKLQIETANKKFIISVRFPK